MKYLFVSIAIFAIWLGTILATLFSRTSSILFPVTALVMTLALFIIGFKSKK